MFPGKEHLSNISSQYITQRNPLPRTYRVWRVVFLTASVKFLAPVISPDNYENPPFQKSRRSQSKCEEAKINWHDQIDYSDIPVVTTFPAFLTISARTEGYQYFLRAAPGRCPRLWLLGAGQRWFCQTFGSGYDLVCRHRQETDCLKYLFIALPYTSVTFARTLFVVIPSATAYSPPLVR